MSYIEYNDLLLKCQKTGKYRLFTLDLIDSGNAKLEKYNDLRTVMEIIYQDILMLEKELNKQILITNEGFKPPFDENISFLQEDWFILGDAVGITIYNKVIPTEVIHKIIELNLKEMNLTNSVHQYDLVYETNNYAEGNNKYYRGYAIQTSTSIHKKPLLKKQVDNQKEPEPPFDLNYYINLINKNHFEAVIIANEKLVNLKTKSRKK